MTKTGNQLYMRNILTAVKTIWRWPNKFYDTRAEQGINFTILKLLIEIIPFSSSTWEKRIFLKVMLSFKKRNLV